MNIVRRAKKGGFTLIELLVVIAIIGILSSVVLVSLNSARQKGTNGRIQEETNQLRTQLESDFNGSTYSDLVGNTTTWIVATSSNVANVNTIVTDIAALNSGSAVLNSVAAATNGVTIYATIHAASAPADYSIYSKLVGGGYFCVSSSGNTVTNTAAAAIPSIAANYNTCQ